MILPRRHDATPVFRPCAPVKGLRVASEMAGQVLETIIIRYRIGKVFLKDSRVGYCALRVASTGRGACWTARIAGKNGEKS